MQKNFFRQDKAKFYDEINLGCYIGFIVVMVTMFLLLLGVHHSIFSLSTIFLWVSHLSSIKQLIAISLIPIYLSLLIFGGGIVGAYLGKKIQDIFSSIVNTNNF